MTIQSIGYNNGSFAVNTNSNGQDLGNATLKSGYVISPSKYPSHSSYTITNAEIDITSTFTNNKTTPLMITTFTVTPNKSSSNCNFSIAWTWNGTKQTTKSGTFTADTSNEVKYTYIDLKGGKLTANADGSNHNFTFSEDGYSTEYYENTNTFTSSNIKEAEFVVLGSCGLCYALIGADSKDSSTIEAGLLAIGISLYAYVNS
jgi:hypothetical protein